MGYIKLYSVYFNQGFTILHLFNDIPCHFFALVCCFFIYTDTVTGPSLFLPLPFITRRLTHHPASLLDVIIGAWKGSYISQPSTGDLQANKPYLERQGSGGGVVSPNPPLIWVTFILTAQKSGLQTARKCVCLFTCHGWITAMGLPTESRHNQEHNLGWTNCLDRL